MKENKVYLWTHYWHLRYLLYLYLIYLLTTYLVTFIVYTSNIAECLTMVMIMLRVVDGFMLSVDRVALSDDRSFAQTSTDRATLQRSSVGLNAS